MNPAEIFALFSQDTKEALKNIIKYAQQNPDALNLLLTAIDGNVQDVAEEMTEYEGMLCALFAGHLSSDVDSIAFTRAAMKMMKGMI